MKMFPLIACVFISLAESSSQTLPVVGHNFTLSPIKELDKKTLSDRSLLGLDTEMLQPNSEDDILDSSYIWVLNQDGKSYDLFHRSLFTYDAGGNTLEWLEAYWDGTQWIDLALTSYAYDENNNLVVKLIMTYDGSAWINSSQTIDTFDSNNDLIRRLMQNWSGNDWVNHLEQVSTFDNLHNELTQTSRIWLGGAWVNSSLRMHTYDLDNRRIHQLIQSWNGEWINNQQLDYTYNFSGDLDSIFNQIWITDHWENQYRFIFEYDGDHHRLSSLQQNPVGADEWTDTYRETYTYNLFYNITELLTQNYTNDEWVNEYQFSLGYDEKQNQISEVFRIWEGVVTYQDSTHFYYTLVSGTKDPVYHNTLTISPNPAQESISIQTNTQPFENITISIYSQAGVKVMEKNMDALPINTLDISKLLPGAYHILVQHDQGIETCKFLKL